jgi:hypothetical protein
MCEPFGRKRPLCGGVYHLRLSGYERSAPPVSSSTYLAGRRRGFCARRHRPGPRSWPNATLRVTLGRGERRLGHNVRRREFLQVVGAAAGWPLAARAQHSIPVVGFLHSTTPEANQHLTAAFRQGLRDAGFVEDQSVRIEYRWAEGQYERLPTLAADLVARRVAVIATAGGVRRLSPPKRRPRTYRSFSLLAAIRSSFASSRA